MSEHDSIVGEFLQETGEYLDELEADLMRFESGAADPEAVTRMLRAAHTIKGTCGFLGFGQLENLTHVAEAVLGTLDAETLAAGSEATSVLLGVVDAARTLCAEIAATGQEGDGNYAELIARLEDLSACSDSPRKGPETRQASPSGTEDEIRPEELTAAPPQGETSLRVHVNLLDELMALIGELVLTRNQILQSASDAEDTHLTFAAQRLNLITGKLQEQVLRTRLQKIGGLWSRCQRVIRDLARANGGPITVATDGEETEVDKAIIEVLTDPLTHLVRNCVDHGIESPEERTLAGKDPGGRISLNAYQQGGEVNIEISDDGGGISAEKLRLKAVARGVISEEEASRLSDAEALNLIFVHGFSTAESITNISGRGVGMDVVKSHIERVGGVIDVKTELGVGTTFHIKIPLTLAIIPALIVKSGAQRYALPQVNLCEIIRLDTGASSGGLELVHDAPVFRLRGQLLPVVDLGQLLDDNAEPIAGASRLVVLRTNDRSFGLIVDAIHDSLEIVVKPLSGLLENVGLFSGATILGDGNVALILDVVGLAAAAGMRAESTRASTVETGTETESTSDIALLLCDSLAGERLAVRVDSISRLELLRRSEIERSGELNVVQYRGGILPLVYLADGPVASTKRTAPDLDETVSVIVCEEGDGQAGLVVHEIHDIVAVSAALLEGTSSAARNDSYVVDGHVARVIDPQELLGVSLRASDDAPHSGAEMGRES